MSWRECNVLNCGNGKCVHELTDEVCPDCGYKLVEVTTTGFKFCSNHESICDYDSADRFEDFDNTGWTGWTGGMKCIYQGKDHSIGSCEFEEKLVGLSVDYSDDLAWVRCENIELVRT